VFGGDFDFFLCFSVVWFDAGVVSSLDLCSTGSPIKSEISALVETVTVPLPELQIDPSLLLSFVLGTAAPERRFLDLFFEELGSLPERTRILIELELRKLLLLCFFFANGFFGEGFPLVFNDERGLTSLSVDPFICCELLMSSVELPVLERFFFFPRAVAIELDESFKILIEFDDELCKRGDTIFTILYEFEEDDKPEFSESEETE